MSTSETRNQDSAAIIIAGGGTEVVDDAPGWERPFTEYDRYGRPTGHNYVRYPVCGAEALDGKTSTTSHRPAYRYK